jgi:thiol:disulfide interchange protein DsbD
MLRRMMAGRRCSGRVIALSPAVRANRLAAWLLAAAIAAGGAIGVAEAAGPRTTAPVAQPSAPRVRVQLVSEVGAIEPGATFWVGLRQQIAPGWHTYWSNPGDSGEAATIEWALPAGFEAGPLAWPHPHRIPVGPVMSYGYSDEVVLPVPITASPGLPRGRLVTLRGLARWLVCEKICIPEESPIALTLPVASARPDPGGARLIASARRDVPQPSPWAASFSATPEMVTLTIAATGLAADRIAEVWFYPSRWGAIAHAAPQEARIDERGITLRAARGPLPEAVDAPIDGVLVVTERLDQGTASQAFALRAVREGDLIRAGSSASGTVSLPRALALALAGGLVLNLMPCVLPVLSVKALSLIRHASAPAATVRRHGLAYTAGVLASFGVVAGALLALRAGGEQIGWGFQLQSPLFVTALAYVLFVMALSLSGIVVIGGGLAGAGHAVATRSGYAGSFFTGALATVAATPCTAPFMAVALGFAVTQPWTTALLVFETLGLGLALPYLLVTMVPAWRRLLPRPGAWMERLKQVLAVPLYASVAWLVWVVSQQVEPWGMAAVLAGLVLVGFAAWLHQVSRTASARWRPLAAATVTLAAVGSIGLGALVGIGTPSTGPPAAETAGVLWEPFSPARLADLRAQGKPVFVNFTAAWCITCLVNERVALRSPAVAEAFARKDVVYLKADWTNRDPQIARVLGSFGRTGVPLYLLYPPPGAGRAPAGEPTMLPQILSEGTIIEAIDKI